MGGKPSATAARTARDIRTPAAVAELPGLPLADGIPAAVAWLEAEIARCKAEMSARRQGSVALYDRSWVPNPPLRDESDAGKRRFIVMQFNILAEGLATKGFDHVPEKECCLAWANRRWRLLEEIVRCSPDLLAMEELDHYADFFRPALAAMGYESFWVAKPNSPCIPFGYFSDGSAIFWKTSAFEALGSNVEGHYAKSDGSEANQVYACRNLRHRETGECVRFVATHLKAGITRADETTRCKQIPQLIAALSSEPASHTIVCGDFNSTPSSTLTFTARCIPAMCALGKQLEFSSAYPLHPSNGSTDKYTLCVRKWGWDVQLMLDYIFHTGGVKPTARLQVPPLTDLDRSRLPGFRYPSDHFAIAVEFHFA